MHVFNQHAGTDAASAEFVLVDLFQKLFIKYLRFQAIKSEERLGPVCDGRGPDLGVNSAASLVGERRLLATGNDWHLHGRIRE